MDDPTPQPEQPFKLPTPDDLPKPEFEPGFDDGEKLLDPETSARLGAAIDRATGGGVAAGPSPATEPPPTPEPPETHLDAETSRRLSAAIEQATGIAFGVPPNVSGTDLLVGATGCPPVPNITMEQLESKFPGLHNAIEVKGWDDMIDHLKDIKQHVANLVLMQAQ